MTKQALHDKLRNLEDTISIPVQDFIDIYGNDKTRMVMGEEKTRAQILANTYNLSVNKQDDNYVFAK